MAFSEFFERLEDSEEKYSVEEIRDAGEEVIDKMPDESDDAREYIRAAINVMITELQGDSTSD